MTQFSPLTLRYLYLSVHLMDTLDWFLPLINHWMILPWILILSTKILNQHVALTSATRHAPVLPHSHWLSLDRDGVLIYPTLACRGWFTGYQPALPTCITTFQMSAGLIWNLIILVPWHKVCSSLTQWGDRKYMEKMAHLWLLQSQSKADASF